MKDTQRTDVGGIISDFCFYDPWIEHTAVKILIVQNGNTLKFKTNTTLVTFKKADRRRNPVPGGPAMTCYTTDPLSFVVQWIWNTQKEQDKGGFLSEISNTFRF